MRTHTPSIARATVLAGRAWGRRLMPVIMLGLFAAWSIAATPAFVALAEGPPSSAPPAADGGGGGGAASGGGGGSGAVGAGTAAWAQVALAILGPSGALTAWVAATAHERRKVRRRRDGGKGSDAAKVGEGEAGEACGCGGDVDRLGARLESHEREHEFTLGELRRDVAAVREDVGSMRGEMTDRLDGLGRRIDGLMLSIAHRAN